MSESPENSNLHPFISKVDTTIRRYSMLEKGEIVVIGVSGGPDSVALLHALIALSDLWSLRLVVAHLNHGLRGEEADRDADFVGQLAAQLHISCEIEKRDVIRYRSDHGLSLEEAARVVRYDFLDSVAAKYSADKIALGHQANDNAESILIHLMRGSGPKGLSGIPPVREGRIIRPLIEVTREEICDFLKEKNLRYTTDTSNADLKYLRNRVRHDLIPHMKDHFNSKIVQNLNRLSCILREEESFWEDEIDSILRRLTVAQKENSLTISVPKLLRLHDAVIRRVVREAVKLTKGDLRRFGLRDIDSVIRLVRSHRSSTRIQLPGGLYASRDRDRLAFSVGLPQDRLLFDYRIDSPGTVRVREIDTVIELSYVDISEITNLKNPGPKTGLFDADSVRFPIRLRNWIPGDRFQPLGMKGTQKVKAFFTNNKVPLVQRYRCPIFLCGEKIIWVGGYRIDDSVKITQRTKRVLKGVIYG
nr:tRNA lysidine(34) synthetase TilS [Desulfobacterales bacterium]